MTEWVRRRNLLTTATPTVYDFIAGSYTLFGNDQKKWQQTPSAMDNSVRVNGLLVSIMKLVCCIFCPTLIDYAVLCLRIISIRTGQKYTLPILAEVKLL